MNVSIRRGEWHPPRLLRSDSRAILIALSIVALLRAFDYATGVDTGVGRITLSTIEAAAPLAGWAAGLAVGVAILAIGMAGRWSRLVVIGHAMLACLYVGLAVGVGVEVVLRGLYFDGIRSVGDLFIFPLLHGMCAARWSDERDEIHEQGGTDAATG